MRYRKDFHLILIVQYSAYLGFSSSGCRSEVVPPGYRDYWEEGLVTSAMRPRGIYLSCFTTPKIGMKLDH
jgi:hypothetical protein